MSIYKDCDIRGIYGKEFSEEDAFKIGRALATISGGGRLYLGGDVRLSTPVLKRRMLEGLVKSGAQVLDLGVIATPVLYFALARGDADGAVMVTASHNPKEYNGFKFMFGDRPVTRTTIDEVKDLVEREAFSDEVGSVRAVNRLEGYFSFLKKRFPDLRGLKVVVDAGNGAMSEIAPKAFQQSGAEVIELFCTPDGNFPNRTPNPAEYRKLTQLAETVRANGADFGVAFDGDGDRAVFASDTGEIIVSERSLALFVEYLLKDHPTPVVYDQKSSSVVKSAILRMGGTPVPERSGHTFIKRRFLDVGAAVAGEVSGHFFFGELGYDDGLFAALLMAEMLKKDERRLSERLKNYVCPPITPDLRAWVPYEKQDAALSAIRALAGNGQISEMDGVRIEWADGWLLARKSVTAEQITLRIEAKDDSALRLIKEKVAKALPAAKDALFLEAENK